MADRKKILKRIFKRTIGKTLKKTFLIVSGCVHIHIIFYTIVTRSMSRWAGTTCLDMRLFNGFAPITRNTDMERLILLRKNPKPARRYSMSNALPVLRRALPARRNSMNEPSRVQPMYDANFVNFLHVNVDDDDSEENENAIEGIADVLGIYFFDDIIR